MKKSDLKNMMIVEMRDGERYVVVDDRLYYGNGYRPLSSFTDDLKHVNRTFESEDIVKVYSPIKYLPTTDDLDHVEQLCTLEWERKEDDPDLPFNGKAVYTGYNTLISTGLTIGKVYIILDGKFPDDSGITRPQESPYLTESTLKSFGLIKLIE